MNGHWGVGRAIFGGGETLEVPCSVDIERTADSFHVYAVPGNVFLRPGDRVHVESWGSTASGYLLGLTAPHRSRPRPPCRLLPLQPRPRPQPRPAP